MEQEKKEHNRTLDALANSMGREIVGYMHDDNINEVALNTDQRLWIDTADHGWEDTGIIIPPPQAKRIIYGVAALPVRPSTLITSHTWKQRSRSRISLGRHVFKENSRPSWTIRASTSGSIPHACSASMITSDRVR